MHGMRCNGQHICRILEIWQWSRDGYIGKRILSQGRVHSSSWILLLRANTSTQSNNFAISLRVKYFLFLIDPAQWISDILLIIGFIHSWSLLKEFRQYSTHSSIPYFILQPVMANSMILSLQLLIKKLRIFKDET